MKLRKNFFKGILIGIPISILMMVAMTVFMYGGFTGSLEKVDFSDAVSIDLEILGERSVVFRRAILNTDFDDVLVGLDSVVVKKDSSLLGTAISASPTFGQRTHGVYTYYLAQSVVIWVPGQQEQEHWENFLQAVRNNETFYQKVLP